MAMGVKQKKHFAAREEKKNKERPREPASEA